MRSIGVSLVNNAHMRGLDAVFVGKILLHALNENFPYGWVIKTVHRIFPSVPFVEVADKGNGLCIGSPYTEVNALPAVLNALVSTEEVESLAVAALVENKERKIIISDRGFVFIFAHILIYIHLSDFVKSSSDPLVQIPLLILTNILTDCASDYKGSCKSFTILTYFLHSLCAF